ncbi:unnamed protein product [Blepharisma stoltei]|uniref:Uncharacterized protein n=1 Tax=Blepharisma stoltei TaxID=1481888 RepID=A0AAU9JT27_9CILI|nr:unnamed protein product [Blepharisma stoltei]
MLVMLYLITQLNFSSSLGFLLVMILSIHKFMISLTNKDKTIKWRNWLQKLRENWVLTFQVMKAKILVIS